MSSPSPSEVPVAITDRRWTWQERVALAGICLLVCFLVWPGLFSDLMLDDRAQYLHVSSFRSWTDAWGGDSFGLFRPVKNVIYYFFRLRGLPDRWEWHGFNLLVYLASTVSVHFLVRRLVASAGLALVITALWATSATQASTAIWMSCVNISLSMIFLCAALICHDRSWEKPGAWKRLVPATLILTFLAQVSYETALCIGPLCILIDLLRQRAVFSKPAMIRYVGVAATTLAFLACRAATGAIHNAKGNLGISPYTTPLQLSLSAPWLVWKHFSMWLSPFGRIEFISTYIWGKSAPMWEIVAAWVFLALLVAAIVMTRKKLPLFAFGIGWFLAACFPICNFIPVRSGPVEDYYLVFPSVGLAIAMAGVGLALWKELRDPQTAGKARAFMKPSLVMILALLLISRLSGMVLFRYQSDLWNNPLKLYLMCKETRDYQFLCAGLAANEFLVFKDYEEADRLAKEAMDAAPWDMLGPMVRAEVAYKQKRLDDATRFFDIALPLLTPETTPYYHCLYRQAEISMNQKKYAQARALLVPILQDPKADFHYEASIRLSNVYIAEGNPQKATNTLKKSLAMHPEKESQINEALQLVQNSPQTLLPNRLLPFPDQ